MSSLDIKFLVIGLIALTWVIARLFLRGMRTHAWIKLIDALRQFDPELYAEMGCPTHFLFQKVWQLKPLGNDRLHYHAIRYPELFAQHPVIKIACNKYRRLAIIEYSYT
jgi:hypothetical protein